MEKSTRWAFTAYEQQFPLFSSKPELVRFWKWNHEVCPQTQRQHYQGAIQTTRQVRFKQIQKLFPGVHFEIPRNWPALLLYCQKSDTQVEGGNHNHADVPRVTLTMDQALVKVAQYRDTEVRCSSEELAEIDKWKGRQYDSSVSSILTEEPTLVGLYAQPIFRNAWIKWSSVFIQIADSQEDCSEGRQTDRQTD